MVRWVFLLALALGARATAADIVVEAGGHADFSRLVLQLPQADNWFFGKDMPSDMPYALAIKLVKDEIGYDRLVVLVEKIVRNIDGAEHRQRLRR